MNMHCTADVALKEEANKKAFEKFTKDTSSSNCVVEAVQVSERYESQFPRTSGFSQCDFSYLNTDC